MSEVRKLNIGTPLRNVDEFAIRDNAYLMKDVVFDEAFSIKKRFGGSFWTNFDVTSASCHGS